MPAGYDTLQRANVDGSFLLRSSKARLILGIVPASEVSIVGTQMVEVVVAARSSGLSEITYCSVYQETQGANPSHQKSGEPYSLRILLFFYTTTSKKGQLFCESPPLMVLLYCWYCRLVAAQLSVIPL